MTMSDISSIHSLTPAELLDLVTALLYERAGLMAECDKLRTAIYRSWRVGGHRLRCNTDNEKYLNEALDAARAELLAVYPIDELQARSTAEHLADMNRRFPP